MIAEKEMQFHWRLIQGGEPDNNSRARQFDLDSVALPGVKEQVHFSKLAEQAGIHSLLTDFSYGKPDPMLLASSLIERTDTMRFLVAIRSGIISPTYFVQQVNTFSALSKGRILLNIVAGHSPEENAYYGDYLAHDSRYDRTEEFLSICNALWKNKTPFDYTGDYFSVKKAQLRTPFVSEEGQRPYIFIAGSSQKAKHLAISQADCWMRMPDLPQKMLEDGKTVLAVGKEVGIRLGIISRPTRGEAVAAARKLIDSVNPENQEAIKENDFVSNSDSVMMRKMYHLSKDEWLNDWLWTGAVRIFGAAAMTMVGSYEDLADALIDYKKAGVTQFIFSGWPKQSEMVNFGKNVLPLVRQKEKNLNISTT